MNDIQITVEKTTLEGSQLPLNIVRFIGQLDETNVDDKAKLIYDLIEDLPAGASVIFDIAELEYMNSKSLGYLSDWYTKIVDREGKLVISQPKENILDILNVVGLSQIMPIAQSLEEAKRIVAS